MKIKYLGEPTLEFGGGTHVDIRFGLMQHGVLDRAANTAPSKLKLGIVGTAKTVEAFYAWIESRRKPVPAKESRLSHLFPHFPGFNDESAFYASIVSDETLQQTLNQRHFQTLVGRADFNSVVKEAVDMVIESVAHLVETANPDVIICAMPKVLHEFIQDKRSNRLPNETVLEFHDLLKAKGLPYRVPLQLVWPYTYDTTISRGRGAGRRQDPATVAWNLHCALYYKAGGVPYRLVRDPAAFDVCYVGVSFYRSLDKTTTMSSMAQVFNQRGEGVIVKGGQARFDKEDRQNHLTEEGAKTLLLNALRSYRREHGNLPARAVVHKTTNHSPEELAGFNAALDDVGVEFADLMSLRNSATRLFRPRELPPLRGTLMELTEREHILYTKGSVPFYRAYPGMYVPRTLNIQFDQIESAPEELSLETLELTKLNYNDTQIDGGAPMTVRAARKVGEILRYVEGDTLPVSHYKFYM